MERALTIGVAAQHRSCILAIDGPVRFFVRPKVLV